MTLQFSAAGFQETHHFKKELVSKSVVIREESNSSADSGKEEIKENEKSSKKSKTSGKAPIEKSLHTKDLQLSMFHALGKFLYNKRVHPKTKKVEQLPFEMMKNPDNRPTKYFKP